MIWSTENIGTHWPIKSLESLTTKVGSGATPRGGRSSYPDHGIPFIRSQNVRFDGFTSDGLAFLTDAQARQLDGATVEPGDVLLNITGASIGRVCVAPPEMAGARVNQHVCIIRPAGIRSTFLARYLASSQVQDAIGLGHYGVTREALTKSQILELPVPVPPFAEQDRLIQIIDAISTHRLRVTIHLRTVQKMMMHSRRAILLAACSGQLTADWREDHPNLHPADLKLARQRRILQTARPFREPNPNPHADITDLPESWRQSPLGLLIREIKYGTSKRCEYGRVGIPVLRIPNVRANRLDLNNLKYAALDAAEAKTLRLEAGDLLMIRSNGSVQLVGKALTVTEEAAGMAYAGYLIRLRVDANVLRSQFLQLALSSLSVRTQIEMPARSTSGVNNINTDEVRGLVVPVPPLEEQDEIVRQASTLFALADGLSAHVNTASKRTKGSSRAILAKAFRGELRMSCVETDDVRVSGSPE